MKILQLMNRVPWPLKDGGAIGFYQLTKGYFDAGAQVTVAALNTSKHFVQTLPEELTKMADWHLFYIDNRVKPLPAFLNLFSSESYNISRFYNKAFEAKLEQLVSTHEFDTIVFESIYMATYLPAIRKHTKALCVLRAHNVECDIWKTLYENESNPLKRRYLHLLYTRLKKFEQAKLNDFDLIVPITEYDKHRLAELGCTVPQYISPTGANVAGLVPCVIPKKPESIYHLGSMEWMPNQEAMLWFLNNVWPRVHHMHPHTSFYLAGRGMPQSFFKLDAAGVQVDGEVADAEAYVTEKHIMVVPLFAGSGMRIKIIEAMARGKVIIATPLGAQGIPGISGQHFILCNTADEFIHAIDSCIREEGKAAAIGRAAHEFVMEHFDNNKVSKRLLSIYEQYLERNKT
ncbi:MAG: glycosyltransferase family 4 protein [Bacteroidota bacterium]|jgi:glycosyltransferase involved in cell wall biosynthesis